MKSEHQRETKQINHQIRIRTQGNLNIGYHTLTNKREGCFVRNLSILPGQEDEDGKQG